MTWAQEPSNRGFTIAPDSAIKSLAEVVPPHAIEVHDISRHASAIVVRARAEYEKDHVDELCGSAAAPMDDPPAKNFARWLGAVMTPCGKMVPRRFAGTQIEAVSACARGEDQTPSTCLQAGERGCWARKHLLSMRETRSRSRSIVTLSPKNVLRS